MIDVLQLVTGDAMPSVISLIPGGDVSIRVSLPQRYEVKDCDICLFADVPTVLRLATSAFQPDESQAACIVVLTAKGLFALKRYPGMIVADVITTLNHNMHVRCSFLAGLLGEKHDLNSACPNIVISRDFFSTPDDLRVLEFVRISVNDSDVTFHAEQQAIRDLMELCQKTAIDEMLAALGWIFTVDVDQFATGDLSSLRLLRRPGALALLHEDMVYCLALLLFLTRIRDWADIGRNPSYCTA